MTIPITKKNYTAEFKSRVSMEALKGELTINEISSKYKVHSSQINRWKSQAIEAIKKGFSGAGLKNTNNQNDKIIDDLYRQIGQLTCENDFLKKNAWK